MKTLLVLGMVLTLRALEPVDPVADRLSHVGMFAFGGIGFAGVRTQGEKDYYSILARPTAAVDFETVFAGKSPAGKAYALVALRKLDAEKFKALAAAAKSSDAKVQTGAGCMIYTKPLGEIVRRIEAGSYSSVR